MARQINWRRPKSPNGIINTIMNDALIGALGAIFGGALVALIQTIANRKNSLSSALHYAAQSLDITGQELAEALLAVKEYRRENLKLNRDYKFLKDITRKLYEKIVEFDIQVGLTDEELETLFDTQPLRLAEEKMRRAKRENS